MQYQTVILTTENWVVGTHDNKDILAWAISDLPWLNIRTLGFSDTINTPCLIKSNSWTDVQVNREVSTPTNVKLLHAKMSARIKLLSELVLRLRSHSEIMGVSDTSVMLIRLHEYLVSNKVIDGTSEVDAKIKYENSIRILQDLEKIKQSTIEKILKVSDTDSFNEARTHMERMFFTNILL